MIENFEFLKCQIFIIWNSGINNSKQILKFLNKNLNIEFNEYNLSLLENIRKFIEFPNEKFNIENSLSLCETQQERKNIEKVIVNLNKNICKTNNLEQRLNYIFNSKTFVNALIESCGADFCYELVVIKIASILLYYLYTRDDHVSYSLLTKIMNSVNLNRKFIPKKIILDGLKSVNNTSDENLLAQKLIENTIDKGYVTHALNPAYIDWVKANGLGSEMENESEKNFSILENCINKNKFLSRQNEVKFYYSFPSINSIHYACAMSPEKIFGGPLKFLNKNTALNQEVSIADIKPIVVGQNIKSYYKKIGYHNISLILKNMHYKTYLIKKILKRRMKKLVDNYCYDYSYILLMPIKNQRGKFLDANDSTIEKFKKSWDLGDFIKNNAYGIGIKFQNIESFDHAYNMLGCITPSKIGQNDESLMANLCSSKIKQITKDCIIIKIPVYYSFLQAYCKRKFLLGTKVITELNPYIKNPLFKVEKYKKKKIS